MGQANSAANVSLLKRLWGNNVAKPMYEKSRLLELAKKDTNFRGELKHVVVNIAPTAGGSASFPDAVASQDPTADKRFNVRRKKEYQVFTVDNEFIEASKGNTAAIVDGLKHQVDGARQAHAEAMARRGWGAGGGSLGRIDAGVNLATNILTLRSRTDIVGVFNVGTQLEFAPDDGTPANPAGRRGAPDRLTVTAVNRDTGAVTLSGNLNTVNGITVNDYVFRRGDYALAMTGLPGWAPITAPGGGDNFMDLDRTADIQRLSGFRITGGGKPKEETLADAGAEAHINGCKPSHCFISSLDYRDVIKELGSKVTVSDGKGTVGMKNVTVYLATGEVELVPEAFVPRGYFWLGNAGEVVLGSAGECPMQLTEGMGKNGLMLLDNADAWQGRLGCYGNIYISDTGKGPGGWGVGAW
jgi:hypothetical protein